MHEEKNSHIRLSLEELKLADENVIMVFPLSVFPLILHQGDHPCVFYHDFRENYLKFFQFVRFLNFLNRHL